MQKCYIYQTISQHATDSIKINRPDHNIHIYTFIILNLKHCVKLVPYSKRCNSQIYVIFWSSATKSQMPSTTLQCNINCILSKLLYKCTSVSRFIYSTNVAMILKFQLCNSTFITCCQSTPIQKQPSNVIHNKRES